MQEIQREISSANQSRTLTYTGIIEYALEEHHMDHLRDNGDPREGYRTQLWTFTRCVKSFFASTANPDAVFFDVVVPEIDSRGGWEILDTWLDPEEIYFEFVCNWDRVRYDIGETPLSNAVLKAEKNPLEPRRCTGRADFLARYAKFVSIAGWLQVTMGNRSILLPVDRLGELMSVKPMTITRYRQAAVSDGYLRVIKEHCYTRKTATEFRFDVSRFSALQGKAQEGSSEAFHRGAE